MKNLFGRGCAVAAVILLAAMPAAAQLEDNLSQLTGDQSKGYLAPLADGLSATMNSNIFKSGDVPFMGFNLTLDLKAVVVSFSDADRVYTTPDLPGFGTTQAPTVIGDTQPNPPPTLSGPGGAQFTYPSGFDLKHFGIVVPQVTIGSIAGTRAMVRFVKLNLGDTNQDLGDFTFWGIGGQHSISRYLPGLPIDLAAGAMLQQFKIGKNDLVKANAFALNVTGSKKFGKIVSVEPYAGVGIDSFSMEAKYDLDLGSGQTLPIDVNFDRQTDFHGTIGAGVNLPGVKLNGELNLAAVNGYAVGLSFGI
jgi:Family of unknown function (DUF6588)